MSTQGTQTASSLEDYLDLFDALARLGTEFVVIGGCAVGAYARLLGEQVLSVDLDLLVTWRSLESIVSDGGALGVSVQKLPQPRTVPVALLEWRGREVNLLTGSSGLPAPDVAARAAREFRIGQGPGLTVLIADPFDLLRNKLAVNRPKDQPHIAILRRFPPSWRPRQPTMFAQPSVASPPIAAARSERRGLAAHLPRVAPSPRRAGDR